MARFFDEFCAPAVRRLVPAWIKPNHITLLRGILVAPVIYWQHRPLLAVALLLLSSACDIFDGVLARVRGETSEGGAALDAWMDKLFVLGTLWLACRTNVPMAMSLLVTAFEVALIVVRDYKMRHEVTAKSNAWGGRKTWAQSIGLALVLTGNHLLTLLASLPLFIGLLFAVGSIVGHAQDIRRHRQEQR